MSLYGMMRTGVSGMAAQANRLATVADNIANSSTTGYKRGRADFSTLVLPNSPGSYNSGGVTTSIRYAISQQGALQFTTSVSDLAIKGDGFMIVNGPGNTPYLTRAGSFVPDENGNLVNAAGMTLLGYSYANGEPTPTANGFAGLVPVNIKQSELKASASTEGSLAANLPSGADAVTGDLPSDNTVNSAFTAKTSLVTYDYLGNEVMLDVYFTKTGANAWEVAVYDKATASATGGFPYSAGPLTTETLTFDPTNGNYDPASATSLSLTIPGGAAFDLDLSKITQLAADYTVYDPQVNGNKPSAVDQINIGTDGIVYAQYADGSTRPLYRIPLATFTSPDNLQVASGNIYAPSLEAGEMSIGWPSDSNRGELVSGALEDSNVDIAEELTAMIESQRSYTANSKVFQTGADLMDVLVNLKR